ncbi:MULTISPECIES: hypothetical protein [Streptomyces]|uniref:hypothetical protein n=1 Tax=Streptomyces TaxID=1883 RepID=UPI00345BE864
MTELLIAAITLATGYLLGRARPLDKLDTWVWRRCTFGGPWVHSRPQRLLTVAALALVRPGEALHAWRHRHDPPPPRSAPLVVRDLTHEETRDA